jgi:hypothetical protein
MNSVRDKEIKLIHIINEYRGDKIWSNSTNSKWHDNKSTWLKVLMDNYEI